MTQNNCQHKNKEYYSDVNVYSCKDCKSLFDLRTDRKLFPKEEGCCSRCSILKADDATDSVWFECTNPTCECHTPSKKHCDDCRTLDGYDVGGTCYQANCPCHQEVKEEPKKKCIYECCKGSFGIPLYMGICKCSDSNCPKYNSQEGVEDWEERFDKEFNWKGVYGKS